MTREDILKQIDLHVGLWRGMMGDAQYTDLSDLPDSKTMELLTRLAAAIDRLAPDGSRHKMNAHASLKQFGETNVYNIQILVGILQALRADYELGYLQSVEELIHADIFSDFLEMAAYLLSEGYKDAAAVLVGGVIEEHLRKLCVKNGIAIEQSGKSRKADALNSDLAGQGSISKLDQKSVTSWLDLRNKAAHAKYGEYTDQQVALLIQSVQDFLSRIPA
jgi:hypothetical protein